MRTEERGEEKKIRWEVELFVHLFERDPRVLFELKFEVLVRWPSKGYGVVAECECLGLRGGAWHHGSKRHHHGMRQRGEGKRPEVWAWDAQGLEAVRKSQNQQKKLRKSSQWEEKKQEEGMSQKLSEEQMSRKGMTSCINRAVWLNTMRTENRPRDLRDKRHHKSIRRARVWCVEVRGGGELSGRRQKPSWVGWREIRKN